ncbi:LemA protein [Nonlabens xylanidelens]|uniref:LemA protein n=1 Tax=Nonlabens xylanidelens TaxID=191564 RepID=A0A2S6IGH9_9FLAO|nr:LemA family protein [Nonlabens xylanidelens]PPK93318.1 LemA protein [Nonlabens xylanidelens]PQJ20863.1 LemA family protein [Nonlabens xylanidelens]
MSKSTALIILIVFVIITSPFCFVGFIIVLFLYNSIVRQKNRVGMSYSGIDVVLKKRYDLVPNLVASVKEYMSHEKELFEKITSLRSKIPNATSKEERFEMENQMSQLLGGINVSLENYPDLKSSENMIQLQRTLTEMEEQISAARRAYNSNVLALNDKIVTVPSNVLAAFLEYKPAIYFETTDSEKINPNVSSLFR